MLLNRAWLNLSAQLTERRQRRSPPPPWESLIERYVPGRSFADIGAMWKIHGGNSFRAEDAGATAVTAFDAMAATPEFEAEHARRSSKVRFVRGDLHDPQTPELVGVHDVVWCTGLMYHAPSPLLSVERLGAMVGEYLILGTKTIPEIPGVPAAAVFFPAMTEEQRKPYSRIWGGVAAPYDPDPVMSYANWWWGFTPSAFLGLGRLGMDVVETLEGPRNSLRDDLIVVLRRRS